MGGRMLDVYLGEDTETLCGNLIQELGNRDQFFIATTEDVGPAVRDGADPRETGMDRMNASFRRFNTDVIDLMQIPNLTDWENQLCRIKAADLSIGDGQVLQIVRPARVYVVSCSHSTHHAGEWGSGGRRRGTTAT